MTWLTVTALGCATAPSTTRPEATTEQTGPPRESSYTILPECGVAPEPVELDAPLDAGFTAGEVFDLLDLRVWDGWTFGEQHPISLSVSASNAVWQPEALHCPAPHVQFDVTVAFEQAGAGFAGSADGLAWATDPGSVLLVVATRGDELTMGFDPAWVYGGVPAEEVGVELALVFAADPGAEQLCGALGWHGSGGDYNSPGISAPDDMCGRLPDSYGDLWWAVFGGP